jgi:hypothetical protein
MTPELLVGALNSGFSFDNITIALAEMLGTRELRRRIILVNNMWGKPGADPSQYWNDICTAISRYFLDLLPKFEPTSIRDPQADTPSILANRARDILDEISAGE